MLNMENPKSFIKPKGITKGTEARKTEGTSIFFENLLKKNDIYAGANHLKLQDGGIIFCNACQTYVSFENTKRHCVRKRHQGKCEILANKKLQARQTLVTLKLFEGENPDIRVQSLRDKTKSILLEFAKLVSDCNISSKNGDLIKDFFHVHSESMENLGHLRTAQD